MEKAKGRRRRAMREAASATWKMERSGLSAGAALRCLIGLAIPLGIGLACGEPANGMVAASGALTAGFGSFHTLRWFRLGPMLFGSVGIALAALIGALVGHNAVGFVLAATLLAYLCGLLATFSQGAWWVGLQCVIYALISSNYPAGIQSAVSRAGLLLAGGLLQTALVALFRRIETRKAAQAEGDAEPLQDRPAIPSIKAALAAMRGNVSPRTEIGREAIRMAVAVGLSAVLSRVLGLTNGYWMPMTTALVLKADLHQTFGRGLARVTGTLAGAGVATLIAATLRPGPHVLAVLVIAFAWLCFTLLSFNYALYAVCITSYVVFGLAIVGLPEPKVVAARTVDTLLGGLLAILAHLIFPLPGEEGAAETVSDIGD